MSHVTKIDVELKDLEALNVACQELGLELRLHQTTYKWFGSYVGDSSLPAGFTKKELGHCEHAIVVKGAGTSTYEIGLVTRRDGKPGFTLLKDDWQGGYGLLEKIGGKTAEKLLGEYKIQAALRLARKHGFTAVRSYNALTRKPQGVAKQRV